MKALSRVLSLMMTICGCAVLTAQSPTPVVEQHLEDKLDSWNLQPADIRHFRVSDMYTSDHNGVTHVYLTQQYNDIDVYNAITTLNIQNEKVLASFNRFVPELSSKINTTQAQIDQVAAVESFVQDLGIYSRERLSPKNEKENLTIYEKTSYSDSDIKVRPVYVVVGDQVRLAWDVEFDQKGSPDYWSARVDAVNGQVLDKHNYTVKCDFGDLTHTHTRECQPHHTHELETPAINAAVVNGASYNVFAVPAESPIHTEGRSMETDGQFPESSPLGWHTINPSDTAGGGFQFAITRGNNVNAYADENAENAPSRPQPDGGAGLVFDFPYNPSQEPGEMHDAAITNLFYMNNMIHDITYLYGFDEKSGNFQGNNFENGGFGNDFVLAEGLDGSGTNNANFATPADGGSGRMQMFLWNATSGVFFGQEPAQIQQAYNVGLPTDWGVAIDENPVIGSVAFVNDGSPQNSTFGCFPLVNEDLAGKVAFADRGGCFFSLKAKHAQDAGAIGVIICNFEDDVINMAGGTDGSGLEVTIPVVMMENKDCEVIRMLIQDGVDVQVRYEREENSGPTTLAGSYDNGIIAHEYGHGISNRLTGGPSAAGCLGNDEQMGEGWSDFFTLIMGTEPGDRGTDRRGIGNYATGRDTEGNGIRSAPYSTDLDIYPRTHADILGTTSPHALGEVWAGTLWDLYWALVDVHGYDADWRNRESGNAKALQLVMDGMKFQPCSPGFLDGRDAIIAADQANYGGENFCIIWNVFARRGFGLDSDQGSSQNRNDAVEDFGTLLPCLGKFLLEKDAQAVVIAGDDVDVNIRVGNYSDEIATGVVITDQIPNGLEVIESSISNNGELNGSTISWLIDNMEIEEEVNLSYTLSTPPSASSLAIWRDDFEDGEDNWLPDLPTDAGPNIFILDNTFAKSGEFSYFISNPETASDAAALTDLPIKLDQDNPVLRVWTRYDTEAGADGGIIEISTDGGSIWEIVDVDQMFRNPYPFDLQYGTFVLPNLEAYSGQSDDWEDSFVDLSAWKGEDVLIRFRFGTDDNTGGIGWWIDDVEVMDMNAFQGEVCLSTDQGENECTSLDGRGIIMESDFTISTKEEIDGLDWTIFPNPVKSILNVKINAQLDRDAQLSIITMSGKTQSSQKISLSQSANYQIDVRDLSAGVYLVEIATNDAVSHQKLVIE